MRAGLCPCAEYACGREVSNVALVNLQRFCNAADMVGDH